MGGWLDGWMVGWLAVIKRSLKGFTTGHFYGRANGSIERLTERSRRRLAEILLASLTGKDAVYAVGLGNKATVTSYGIRAFGKKCPVVNQG
jgi:hypothetical protein